ncbi:hypothetical protein KAR91_56225 [Candidatus Pacearchaeota archaeon]|nr:hypothetical protein [Candidatus Pacearchaeota archaeon]
MKINIYNPNTGSKILNTTVKQFVHILKNPLEDESLGAQFLYDYDDLEFEILDQNKKLIDKKDLQSNLTEKYRQKTNDLIDKNKELIEALRRISAYQSIETLQKNSKKDWGLEYEEALEMSYENMQSEAKTILKPNKK